MTAARALLALALAASAASAADKKGEISEDITIRARPAGPGVEVAPPAASRAVVDEVLRSLSLGRGRTIPQAERIGVEADVARVMAPFPEGPFLSFSAENVAALYDRWEWEVLDDEGRVLWRQEGVGTLQERLDWDGTAADRRFVLTAGRSYRYRFTGRRGDRTFVVESEPLPLASFAYKEYAGETRVEAALPLLFDSGKATLARDADRWIEHFSSRLRLAEQRADGSYKLELLMKDPRSELAKARAKLLSRRLAKSLVVAPKKVVVLPVLALRGEAVAALLPPSKGPSLRIE